MRAGVLQFPEPLLLQRQMLPEGRRLLRQQEVLSAGVALRALIGALGGSSVEEGGIGLVRCTQAGVRLGLPCNNSRPGPFVNPGSPSNHG